MNNPLEITIKGFTANPRLEALVQEKFDKIKIISNDITKCHVVIEKLSKHHIKGNAYCVRLDLKLAHFSDIVISEEAKEGELPLTAAVRDVFRKAHEAVRKHISRCKQKVARPDKAGFDTEEDLELE